MAVILGCLSLQTIHRCFAVPIRTQSPTRLEHGECTAHPRSPSTATYSTWWNSLPTLAVCSPIMPRWSKTWPPSRQSQLLWLPPAQQSVAEPLSSPIEQGWSLCGSHHQHSYVCCGNLGAVPKAQTAAGTLPPEVPATIMGIHWQDYDTNIKVPERARMPRIKAMLLHRHLRWADHVVVMEWHQDAQTCGLWQTQ